MPASKRSSGVTSRRMDEPTIPIRPLADSKPAAKPEPAPTPKAEAPQPKSQPAPAAAPAPKPQPAAPQIDPSLGTRIEPWLATSAPKAEPGAFKLETAADAWLGLLATRGIEYLFANGGTDF